MNLSPSQIATYASQAGFSGNSLAIAVAIAMAESGGNTTAYNPEIAAGTPPGSGSRGLWQIYGYAHPQYNNNTLYDPLTNARAAYQVSSHGTNFTPWTTYRTGEYKRYMINNPVSPVVVSSGQAPWWTFNRIDNFGSIDPQGNYWKPDSNILTPSGYPVVALLPGIITNVQRTSWGQTVVTEKLDTQLNTLATHMFFEHMHDASVQAGQRVTIYTPLGHANYTGEGAALGVGLYSGDIYGKDPGWSLLQNDLKPGGQGLLNPVTLLNNARAGNIPTSGSGGNLPISYSSGTYIPVMSQVHNTLVNVPGFYGIALAIDEAEQFPGWIDLTSKSNDLQILGQDTGFDPIGLARSIGATITDNALALVIRSTIALMGIVLMFLLLARLASPALDKVAPIIAGAA